uniref:Uncharacterized protein n=1 Tax=Mastacembelus armatus TaxID=205130 RepID=A0A3Q3KX39_9TELE
SKVLCVITMLGIHMILLSLYIAQSECIADNQGCCMCAVGSRVGNAGSCRDPQCVLCGLYEYMESANRLTRCFRQPYCDPNKNFPKLVLFNPNKQLLLHCSSEACLTCILHTEVKEGLVLSTGNHSHDAVCASHSNLEHIDTPIISPESAGACKSLHSTLIIVSACVLILSLLLYPVIVYKHKLPGLCARCAHRCQQAKNQRAVTLVPLEPRGPQGTVGDEENEGECEAQQTRETDEPAEKTPGVRRRYAIAATILVVTLTLMMTIVIGALY